MIINLEKGENKLASFADNSKLFCSIKADWEKFHKEHSIMKKKKSDESQCWLLLMNVKQCMCESNTNSTHIMKDSKLVTHINEGHSGIVTDQFMLSFSS